MKVARTLLAASAILWLGACSTTPLVDSSMQRVSDLVALPEFIPGMGALYVNPATLPIGPFAAYDRKGALVSTIFMVPLEDFDNEMTFDGLPVVGNKIVAVDMNYMTGHPGVPLPHYHIVVWHVDPSRASLE